MNLLLIYVNSVFNIKSGFINYITHKNSVNLENKIFFIYIYIYRYTYTYSLSYACIALHLQNMRLKKKKRCVDLI